EGAARAHDLYAVVVPIDPNGCVCGLVGPVQDCVANELLQRRQGVGLGALLDRAAHGGPVVRDQLVVDSPEDVLERSIDQELVDDGITQRIACDSEKLNVGAGEEVTGAIAENQNAQHCGNGGVGRDDHLGGRKSLLEASVVRLQHVASERRGKVTLLEEPEVEVVKRSCMHRLHIEGPVAILREIGLQVEQHAFQVLVTVNGQASSTLAPECPPGRAGAGKASDWTIQESLT